MNEYQHQIARVFRELMPKHGMTVREEQIRLSEFMLDAFAHQKIALCDAGTGIGKTYSYLMAGLLRRQADASLRPVLISTSSIALQTAIVEEYVPFLSKVLCEAGLIDQPLRAVVRKGKSRYVCDKKLERRLQNLRKSGKNAKRAAALESLWDELDLDRAKLSEYDLRQVQVESCAGCVENRRYRAFVKQSRSPEYAIQICNHNLLIADALHKESLLPPLLPDHSALVIDEAHKLPEAMRQMFSTTLTNSQISGVLCGLREQGFLLARDRLGKALYPLQEEWEQIDMDDDAAVRFPYTKKQESILKDAVKAAEAVLHVLRAELRPDSLRALRNLRTVLAVFANPKSSYIRYASRDAHGDVFLSATAQNCEQRLRRILWDRCESAVLTSGTLAVGTDFTRFRDAVGLEHVRRVRESVFTSPFDYASRCLLYFPAASVSPTSKDTYTYITEITDQIADLIRASGGHTLILFTSYSMMSAVYEGLLAHELPCPLFPARRNADAVIREFKQRKNGVLLGTGALWEGLDFPGDLVTSLIIPRLPFAIPDAISEVRRNQYLSLQEYLNRVIVPDMQIKLRQGFGRAFRTETDTCVVSILDSRALPGARYHRAVLEALPSCASTRDSKDIASFLSDRKTK